MLSYINVSFCRMSLNKNGVYKRVSPFYEVPVKKSDMYSDVLSKALLALKMDANNLDNFVLVRLSGSIVPDDNIQFGKGSNVWTLGRYLNKLHTSPEKLQLGVASMEATNEVGL